MTETPDEQPKEPEGSGPVSQDDIDALLSGADTGAPGSQDTQAQADSGGINQADTDALSSGAGEAEGGGTAASEAEPQPEVRVDSEGRPFDEAAAAMAAAIEEDKDAKVVPAQAEAVPQPTSTPGGPVPDAKPLELKEFGDRGASSEGANRIFMLNDVNLRVKLELGRTRMLVEDVLRLGEGSVVGLDKLAGDPVDVLVNDRLIARGEVLILNDSFCVRISEVMSEDPHRKSV